MAVSESNLLDLVCERIKSDKDRLERNELARIEVDCFNLPDFWNQFGAAVQSLSNEVTKVGFMCGKKPFPKSEEMNAMLQDMMQHYNMMKELFLVLPESVGGTIYGAVSKATLNILDALLAITNSLYDLTDKGARERLTLTGTFWDACNTVETLPKTNLSAVDKVLEDETAMAVDAKDELATTLEEDSEEWTSEERELAAKALGLVKVAQLLLRRVQKSVAEFGSSDSPQHNQQLDQTAAVVRTVSPALDDFVSELYHPVDVPTTLDNAGKLVVVLRDVLSTVRDTHFAKGINKDMDKLLLFISHNHSKVDPSVTDPVPQLANLSFS